MDDEDDEDNDELQLFESIGEEHNMMKIQLSKDKLARCRKISLHSMKKSRLRSALIEFKKLSSCLI